MTANTFYYGEKMLTLLFRLDRDGERRALEAFHVAFGGAAGSGVVTEDLTALHIRPGCPKWSCNGGSNRGESQ